MAGYGRTRSVPTGVTLRPMLLAICSGCHSIEVYIKKNGTYLFLIIDVFFDALSEFGIRFLWSRLVFEI